jgi:DNA-binding protein H-NS
MRVNAFDRLTSKKLERRTKSMPQVESLAALRARIRELEKQAKKLETAAEEGIREAAKVITRYNLSASDWSRAVASSKKQHKGVSKLAGKRVPIKYADDKGNRWSGRGRTPRWLAAAEKAGKKRTAFLVKSKESARAVVH